MTPGPAARGRAAKKTARARGYTLVQLLVAIALMSMVAALAIPVVASQNAQKLDLAAREVAAALNFARSEALRTGKYHGVRIGSADSRVRVFRLNMSPLPPSEVYNVVHPIDKKLYDISLGSAAFSAGVSVTQSTFQFSLQPSSEAVTFNPDGRPLLVKNTGQPALLISGSATVSRQGASKTITVEPETGRVGIS